MSDSTYLHDLKIDPSTQDLQIGVDNDLNETSGEETVRQKAFILTTNVLSDYIGEMNVNPNLIKRRVRESLVSDPRISEVTDISIDKGLDTTHIDMTLTTDIDETFDVDVHLDERSFS